MHLLHVLFHSDFQRLRLYAAWTLYAAVLMLGSLPGARQEVGHFLPGVILHLATYSAIAFLLYTGMQASPAGRAIRTVGWIALMGAADELVQSFLPYRTGAVSDWAIDVTAGVVVSTVLWSMSRKLGILSMQNRKQGRD